MVVQHNLMAINSNRSLKVGENSKAKTAEKIASGYRINRAADDAAGLSISEKMRKQIRGLTQGITNTEDAISLCQVADGALAEVHDMLHRINELAIQAANGTNSDSDRMAIQDEVSSLLTEIDRIGDTTKFNELYVFRGIHSNLGTNGVNPIQRPEDTFHFNQLELTDHPIVDRGVPNNFNYMHEVNLGVKGDNGLVQMNWRFLWQNDTSLSINVTYSTGAATKTECIMLADTRSSNPNVTINNFTHAAGSNTWSRTYQYNNNDGLNIDVVQKIVLESKTADSQYYSISYEVINNSNNNISFDFMHHEDTAFNDNDTHDSFYIGGKALDQISLYTTSNVFNGINHNNLYKQPLDNFSISNLVDSLPGFSENIQIKGVGGVEADTVAIAEYEFLRYFDYYDHTSPDNIFQELGEGTKEDHQPDTSKDLGFSLIWHGIQVAGNSSSAALSFKQGIKDIDQDPNIDQDELAALKTGQADPRLFYQNLWIQSGAETMDGMQLHIGYMNTSLLRIQNINVLTENSATNVINKITFANSVISAQRSLLGAQQNRLEHTVKNEANVVENTTASESRIRDTDMAKEMVTFSLQNVLNSANSSVLAQANQSKQGLLNLIAA